MDGLADMAAERGMGLLWPGAVPAGEFEEGVVVAFVFGPCDGAHQDVETVGVVALVGGGERAGVRELDPVGLRPGIAGGAADRLDLGNEVGHVDPAAVDMVAQAGGGAPVPEGIDELLRPDVPPAVVQDRT